jgi:hypothetical protein
MPLSGSLVADGCDTASLVSRLGEDGGVTPVEVLQGWFAAHSTGDLEPHVRS